MRLWPSSMKFLSRALFVGLSVTACTSSLPETPNTEDASRALAAEFRGPILDVALNGCRSGTFPLAAGGEPLPVQVCDYCAVSLRVGSAGNEFRGGGTRLVAFRSSGGVVFRQAISYQHSDVSPARGEPGVWVAQQVTRTGSESRAVIPDDLATRIGFRSQSGWDAFGNMAMNAGSPPVPQDAREQLEADSSLRQETAEVVGVCSRPDAAETSAGRGGTPDQATMDAGGSALIGLVSETPVRLVSAVPPSSAAARDLEDGSGADWWSSLTRRFRGGYDSSGWGDLHEIELQSYCHAGACQQKHALRRYRPHDQRAENVSYQDGSEWGEFSLTTDGESARLLYDGSIVIGSRTGNLSATLFRPANDIIPIHVRGRRYSYMLAYDLRRRVVLSAMPLDGINFWFAGVSSDGSRIFFNDGRSRARREPALTMMDVHRARSITLEVPGFESRTVRWKIAYPVGTYIGETGYANYQIDRVRDIGDGLVRIEFLSGASMRPEQSGPWALDRVDGFNWRAAFQRPIEARWEQGRLVPVGSEARLSLEPTFQQAFRAPRVASCPGVAGCLQVELNARPERQVPAFVTQSMQEARNQSTIE